MMDKNPHNDFDQFINKKLNNRKFEYQDSFWGEMEELLPPEKKNRSKPWLWLFFSLLGIGLAGWHFYPNSSNSKLTAEPIITFDAPTISPSERGKTTYQNKAKTTDNTTLQENSRYPNKGNVEVEPSLRHPIIDHIKPSTTFIKQQQSTLVEKEVKDETLTNISQKELSLFKKDSIQAKKELVENTADSLFAETPQKLELLEKEENTLSIFELLTTKSWELPAQEDSLMGVTKNHPLLPNKQFLSFGITAGLSAAQGFINNEPLAAPITYSPFFGIRGTKRFSPTWELNAEILYTSRGGTNSVYSYDSITYSFGVTQVSGTVEIQKLDYVELPIYVNYRIQRHRITAGFSVGILLNTLGQENQEFANSFTPNALDLPAQQQSGTYNGFNPIDYGVMLGYDFNVYEGWRIGLRANYNFRDITKNDNPFNGSNTMDNNLYIRLFATYDLFKF